MTQWQPIATAPRDGTRVLIYPGTWPARWNEEIHWRDEIVLGWLIAEQDDPWYTIYTEDRFVTHWKPLPEPPEGE